MSLIQPKYKVSLLPTRHTLHTWEITANEEHMNALLPHTCTVDPDKAWETIEAQVEEVNKQATTKFAGLG